MKINEELTVDLFLNEADGDEKNENVTIENKPPVTPPVEKKDAEKLPVENQGDEPPMEKPEPPMEEELKMTSEKVTVDNIDLPIVNPNTSKMISYKAFVDVLKNINRLIDLQNIIELPADEKQIQNFKELKSKTKRLKQMMLMYLENFKNYDQEEIDSIKPKFENIITKLVKNTKDFVTTNYNKKVKIHN